MNQPQVNIQQLINASRKNHRIDVVELAEKLGLQVYSVNMPEAQSGALKYDKANDQAFIEVNRNHPVTRQRFTVAHEISHFLKDWPLLVKKGQLDRGGEYKNNAEVKIEREADQQAAAMLMPADIVEDYFTGRKWSKKTRFDADMINDIATTFWVSPAMVATRLRELDFPVPYLSFA